MSNNFPVAFDQDIKPLDISGLSPEDNEATAKLAEQDYKIYVGLTPECAEAILKMSREADMLEYVPKDHSQRFADQAATERWLSKGRIMFLLMHGKDNDSLRLAGYGWAGPSESEQVAAGKTTFAVRIGEVDQGKGLATPFSKLIVDGSATLYGAQDYWLETWLSNAGAVHVYHKIGFSDVSEKVDQRPTADGGRVEDTRLFMRLDNSLLPHAS